jgi:hypothetical protein
LDLDRKPKKYPSIQKIQNPNPKNLKEKSKNRILFHPFSITLPDHTHTLQKGKSHLWMVNHPSFTLTHSVLTHSEKGDSTLEEVNNPSKKVNGA